MLAQNALARVKKVLQRTLKAFRKKSLFLCLFRRTKCSPFLYEKTGGNSFKPIELFLIFDKLVVESGRKWGEVSK